jgi:hypothetical protein
MWAGCVLFRVLWGHGLISKDRTAVNPTLG